MKNILVIPSNREDCLAKFFEAWRGKGGWDEVVLIEDNPDYSFGPSASLSDKPVTHFSHKQIQEILAEDSWIISKQDSACRCFGFLVAYHLGADYVLTLDDDCYPFQDHEDIFARHIEVMENQPIWQTSVPELRVRGLPYENLGQLSPLVANVGLWSGNPDLDAKTQIENEEKWKDFGSKVEWKDPPSGTRILAKNRLAPLSGMNLCITRKALPLFYFPLMGQGQPYHRFDDIWAGIIAKCCCDQLDWQIGIGEPFVNHIRASNAQENLVKEATGMEANEWFWQEIKRVFPPTSHTGIGRAGNAGWLRISTTGRLLASCENHNLKKMEVDYIRKLGRALSIWAGLFEKKPLGL